MNAIDIQQLNVTYRTHFWQPRSRAVREVSFAVEQGEAFGFVGPNGAGKTTTIRVLMGLMRPDSGACKILGHLVPSRAARSRLGFMPEAPYFYDYLTAREMLDLSARLFGIDVATRRKRGEELLELVGLTRAADMPVRKYSKGMMQRAGIAQALINDPEVVVLDEPMSGLDPIGRKEVRDIIIGLRDAGKTVFFSTHILHDVETVCDRVAIIVGGEIKDVGALSALVTGQLLSTDVSLRLPQQADADAVAAVQGAAQSVRRLGDELTATLAPEVEVNDFLAQAAAAGCAVVSVSPRLQTLEDLFMERAQGGGA